MLMMLNKLSLVWVALVATGVTNAFSIGSRSFAVRRSSSLSMNIENMPTKDVIRVGVIGTSLLLLTNYFDSIRICTGSLPGWAGSVIALLS